MTPKETVKAMAMLRAAYPARELTKDTLALYAAGLQDLAPEGVYEVLKRHIATSKWFPAISELRETYLEAASNLPTEEDAIAEVRSAMSKYSYTETPEWSCPEVREAVGVIGWRNWCLSENPASTRARFLDAYRNVRRRAMHDAQASGISLRLTDAEKTSRIDAGKVVANLADVLKGGHG